MDLKELETFVKVAELRSFSKTAEELNVTQPTITNHVQSLEKSLNTILVNRKGRNITLTENGELLYKYAIDILNSCAMARHELYSKSNELVGHLNIESCAVPRKHFLPYLLQSFIEENPKVTFSITGDYTGKSISKLKNRELDFAIVGYTTEDEDIEFVKILEEDILLVLPRSAPYENYSYIDGSEAIKYNLLLKESSLKAREWLYNELKTVGINEEDFKVVGFSDDLDTTRTMISLGLGCSLLAKKSVEQDVALGNCKAVYIKNLDISMKFYFAYPKDRYIFPINHIFKDYVLDYVKLKY